MFASETNQAYSVVGIRPPKLLQSDSKNRLHISCELTTFITGFKADMTLVTGAIRSVTRLRPNALEITSETIWRHCKRTSVLTKTWEATNNPKEWCSTTKCKHNRTMLSTTLNKWFSARIHDRGSGRFWLRNRG